MAPTIIFTNNLTRSFPANAANKDNGYQMNSTVKELKKLEKDDVLTLYPACDLPQNMSTTDLNLSVETLSILQAPVRNEDVRIRRDGIIYLPEIKYRTILIAAFGPGGWSLIARGPLQIVSGVLMRDYALFINGTVNMRMKDMTNAVEALRSNALMRCCKDLGIAKELWEDGFVHQFKTQYAEMREDNRGKKEWFLRRNASEEHVEYEQ
ncbi:mitochondrial genome maintenance MGM101 [Rozella allomycis CSF55]|uniref:Mitochondrial genome maintenance protein MGM101 n=1 Tax=Rozella allomycis (strain CSF55) TaxID=988480 RepID=A0A075AXC3_ROZAC|nr:Mitochondrial genome maintenance MGM101 domain-containing protein [Rozella allomycis CSF55]RKP19982.1 mitochondrial genome maintenance MGM101 [Rozella allomycis CSF55]|eukprot:EPZ33174.1 Mitochondrial genome maintenance MGM101 domain-containing protein [Rozella allomycis CSF55]